MARGVWQTIVAAIPMVSAVSLPWPVSTSYGSLDPEASAAWMVRYLGAESIESNWTVSCGNVSWVRMPGSGYEFHFVATPQLANSTFSFGDYVAYVDELYGNLSEQTSSTYDQFMDFHVGMIVDDMTPFYLALKTDNVPFFMVGQYPAFFDLFVEIPHTGAILEMTSQRLDVDDADLSLWDICQDAENHTLPATTSALSSALATNFSTVNWRKTTFAAPYPIAMELFSIKYLNATHIQQGHPGVWLRRCAKIAWLEFDYVGPAGIPYQFHMVDGYSYPPKSGLDVPQFAKLQEAQRDFAHDKLDEWAHNHLAMWVDDLSPYYAAFRRDNISSLLRTDGGLYTLLVDTTPLAGNVLGLVSDTLHIDFQPTLWGADFCGESPPPGAATL